MKYGNLLLVVPTGWTDGAEDRLQTRTRWLHSPPGTYKPRLHWAVQFSSVQFIWNVTFAFPLSKVFYHRSVEAPSTTTLTLTVKEPQTTDFIYVVRPWLRAGATGLLSDGCWFDSPRLPLMCWSPPCIAATQCVCIYDLLQVALATLTSIC